MRKKRRIAIVAVHGIGDHPQNSHSGALAAGLVSSLGKDTCVVEAAYLQMPMGTPVSDLPPFAFRVLPGASDDIASVDLIEPNWSKFTKGFESRRTLRNAFLVGLDSVQVSLRKSSRKTAAEQLFALGAISIAIAAVFFGPVAAVGLARLARGEWFDTLVLAAALLVAGDLLFRTVRKLWNIRGYAQMFRLRMAATPELPWLLRATFAHLESTSTSRSLSLIPLVQAISLVLCVSVVVAVAIGYFAFRQLPIPDVQHFGGIAVLEAVAILIAFPIARILLATLRQGYGPLEDIVTFCTFGGKGAAYRRRTETIDFVAQHIVDCLNVDDLEDAGRPFYDEVYVFGHSMGSFIAMRALLRVEEVALHGALSASQFSRLCGLVTYGAAVEKVVAHFGLQGIHNSPLEVRAALAPTDLFGPGKIPWLNVYYLWDVVADPIDLFGAACQNKRLSTPWKVWSHSSYQTDSRFWRIVQTEIFGEHSTVTTISATRRVVEFIRARIRRVDLTKIPGLTPITVGGLVRVAALFGLLGGVCALVARSTTTTEMLFATLLLPVGIMALQFTIRE